MREGDRSHSYISSVALTALGSLYDFFINILRLALVVVQTSEIVVCEAYLGHVTILDRDTESIAEVSLLIHPSAVLRPMLACHADEEVVDSQTFLVLFPGGHRQEANIGVCNCCTLVDGAVPSHGEDDRPRDLSAKE